MCGLAPTATPPSTSPTLPSPLAPPSSFWTYYLDGGPKHQNKFLGLSSPPPTPSVSSLALNPTSVTGGNSSSGTVTLSGLASAGGAQVVLSEQHTAVARVPRRAPP